VNNKPSSSNKPATLIEEYQYEARGSDALLRKVKLLRPDGSTTKRWDHFDDKTGDWKPGYRHLKIEPALYRGRELRKILDKPADVYSDNGREIVVVDGEKDVNTGWDRGRPTVCCPHNMGNWRRKDLEKFLPWKDRISFLVIPDQDGGEGEEQAEKFIRLARSLGFEVRLRRPRSGKDLTDHFAAGYGWGDLSAEEPGSRERARGWLRRALTKVETGQGRNDTGLWLAGQLWDSARLDRPELEAVMREYQATVEAREQPYYTWTEALATINQVCNRERRQPAGRWNGEAPEAELSYEGRVEKKLNELRAAQEEARVLEAARKLHAKEQVQESGVSRILSWKQIQAVRPPEFLVDGWLPVASFGVIYGKPGEFKTFVTADLGGAVATGRSWLGNAVLKSGPVVYVAAEGSSGVSVRLLGWAKYRNQEPEEFRMLPETVNLLDGDGIEELIAELEEIDPAPLLVIFDTMARSMVGGDENSARDIGKVIDAGGRIIRELGAAVVYVHHTGLEGERERGSTALRGAADWMAKVSKNNDREGEIKNTKQKDAPEALTIRFRMKEVEGIETAAGPRTTLVPEVDQVIERESPGVVATKRDEEWNAMAKAVLSAIRAEKEPISLRGLTQPGVVDTSVPKRKIEPLLSFLIGEGAPVKRVKKGSRSYYVYHPSPPGVSNPWDHVR
jgi:RecA-family ATPase